jgi:triosephosphate isomerase
MKKIIVGNLKSSMLPSDVSVYLKEMQKGILDDVIICPTSIYVPYFLKQKYEVGLQDICWSEENTTGEINALQASSMGIKYTIVGHFERKESLDIINVKIKQATKYGITSIVCIGEEEKNVKKIKRLLPKKLDIIFKNNLLEKVIIAYEPTWSIGTNDTPTNQEIEEIVTFIKDYLNQKYHQEVKVLYGGSVNNENIDILKNIDNIDGFVIGEAATHSSEFQKIISIVRQS